MTDLDRLSNKERGVVARYNGVPMSSPDLENTLQAELPGVNLAVILGHVGGGKYGYSVRIGDVWLPAVRMGAAMDLLVALDVDERDFAAYREERAERRAVQCGTL